MIKNKENQGYISQHYFSLQCMTGYLEHYSSIRLPWYQFIHTLDYYFHPLCLCTSFPLSLFIFLDCCLRGQSFRDRLTQARVGQYVWKTDRIGACPWARLTHGRRDDWMVLCFPNLERLPLGSRRLMGLNCFNPSQGQKRGSLASLFVKLRVICRQRVGRQGKVLSLLFWDYFHYQYKRILPACSWARAPTLLFTCCGMDRHWKVSQIPN